MKEREHWEEMGGRTQWIQSTLKEEGKMHGFGRGASISKYGGIKEYIDDSPKNSPSWTEKRRGLRDVIFYTNGKFGQGKSV